MSTQSSTEIVTESVKDALGTARERLEPAVEQVVVIAKEKAADVAEFSREQVAPKVADALHAAAEKLDQAAESGRTQAALAAAAAKLDKAADAVHPPQRKKWPWVLAGAAIAATAAAMLARKRRAMSDGASDAPYDTGHFATERPGSLAADGTDLMDQGQQKIEESVATAKEAVTDAAAKAEKAADTIADSAGKTAGKTADKAAGKAADTVDEVTKA